QLTANPLSLNGSTIRDAAGNDAVLTFAQPGAIGSLASNQNIGIDGSQWSPTINSSSSINIMENNTNTVYQATAYDADGTTSFSWYLSGVDADIFLIDNTTGAVSFKNSPNYESPIDKGWNNVYDINLTVSDGALISNVKPVAISVTNVQEVPLIISGPTASVVENTIILAYWAEATNPENFEINWTLSGVDADIFLIDNRTGAVSFKNSPDYESPIDTGLDNIYDFILTASSASYGELNTDPFSVSISVTNSEYDDPPVVNGIMVRGNQVILTFNEQIYSTNLLASRFQVLIGGVAATPTSVNQTDFNIITLTLATSPPSSSTISVVYTDLTTADDFSGVIQDPNGNDMQNLLNPGLNADTFSSALSVTSLASSFLNLQLTGAAVNGSGNSMDNRIWVVQDTAVANILIGGAGIDSMDAANGSDIYLIASSTDHSAAEFNDTGTSGTDELRFASITAGQTLSVFATDRGLEK
ncbi:MAG: SwmB domain-containing protein, partial [Cyanobacteriota bacterium]